MSSLKGSLEMILILTFIFGVSNVCRASSQEVSKEIQSLKDPSLSEAKKSEISQKIESQAKDAIPPLIQCVGDSTPIAKVPMTGGECVNLPATVTPPPHCKNPLRKETLGERCEQLLYQILTSTYSSPFMTQQTSKQVPPPPFVIPDWKVWWEKYQSESLEIIRQEARKKIDEFWQQGHQQSVVWKN